MTSNGKSPGKSAGNTFKPDEIEAVLSALAIVRRGGDASIVARSAPMVSVQRKFLHMQQSLRKQIAEIP